MEVRGSSRIRSLASRLVHLFAIGAVAGALYVPDLANAQSTPISSVVDEAEKAYTEARFGDVVALLRTPLEDRLLTGESRRKALEFLGRSYVKMGNLTQAKQAFKTLHCEFSDWRPSPILVPPEEIAAFDEAIAGGCVEPPLPSAPPPPGHGRRVLTGRGVKAGVDFAGLHGSRVDNLQSTTFGTDGAHFDVGGITRFAAGAFAEFSLWPEVAVQPELMFVRNGGRAALTSSGATLKQTLTVDYLELSILGKWILPLQSGVHPVLYLGPSGALKIGSTVEIESGSGKFKSSAAAIRSTDFGIAVGGEATLFQIRGGVVILDARYRIGLKDIADDGIEDDLKTNTFLLMAGLKM